jgi:uncharacterized protein (UPF0333 family)
MIISKLTLVDYWFNLESSICGIYVGVASAKSSADYSAAANALAKSKDWTFLYTKR